MYILIFIIYHLLHSLCFKAAQFVPFKFTKITVARFMLPQYFSYSLYVMYIFLPEIFDAISKGPYDNLLA